MKRNLLLLLLLVAVAACKNTDSDQPLQPTNGMGTIALYGTVGREEGGSVKVVNPGILKKHWQDALTASNFHKEISVLRIEKQRDKDGETHYLFIAPFKDASGFMAAVLIPAGKNTFLFATPENAVVCNGDCPAGCIDVVSKGGGSAAIATSGCPGCIKTEVIIH